MSADDQPFATRSCALLPVMLAERRGQIVYVSSRIAAEPIARYAAYAASKAGPRVDPGSGMPR